MDSCNVVATDTSLVGTKSMESFLVNPIVVHME